MGRNKCSKHLICRKNVVTRKCCLQVTICLEDKIFPQIRNTILARKLSCVEGCNTGFNEAHPSSHFSCMTMVFCFFWWSRGNRVRIMRWPNIFKIQWLYWDDLRPEFLIANQDNTNRFCFRFEKGQAAMTTSVEPTNLDPLKSFKSSLNAFSLGKLLCPLRVLLLPWLAKTHGGTRSLRDRLCSQTV